MRLLPAVAILMKLTINSPLHKQTDWRRFIRRKRPTVGKARTAIERLRFRITDAHHKQNRNRAKLSGLVLRTMEQRSSNPLPPWICVHYHALQLDSLVATDEHNAEPDCLARETCNENVRAGLVQALSRDLTAIFAWVKSSRRRFGLA
jgi:hypothetical protein